MGSRLKRKSQSQISPTKMLKVEVDDEDEADAEDDPFIEDQDYPNELDLDQTKNDGEEEEEIEAAEGGAGYYEDNSSPQIKEALFDLEIIHDPIKKRGIFTFNGGKRIAPPTVSESGKPLFVDGRSEWRKLKYTGLMPNTNEENLDYDCFVARTNQGYDQIFYKGFRYICNHNQSAHCKAYNFYRWRCMQLPSKRGEKTCSATIRTTFDGTCVYKDTVRGTHDHPPVPERTVKAVLFRETVSRMVKDRPDLRPMQIIADLKILHQSTWTYLKLKESTVLRNIQNYLKKKKDKEEIEKKMAMGGAVQHQQLNTKKTLEEDEELVPEEIMANLGHDGSSC